MLEPQLIKEVGVLAIMNLTQNSKFNPQNSLELVLRRLEVPAILA